MEKMLLKMICIRLLMFTAHKWIIFMCININVSIFMSYFMLNASTGLPASSRIIPVVSQTNSSSGTGEEQIGPEPVNINLIGKSPGCAVLPQFGPLQSMRHLSKHVILMFQFPALLRSQFTSGP